MSSRDVWSTGSGRALRDLLQSALGSLLLARGDNRPIYFCSPWMSDFVLLENHYRQFTALVPEFADEPRVWLSHYLAAVARLQPVRIVTVSNRTSDTFVAAPRIASSPNIEVRFAAEDYHEKGILSPLFYFEGSMNITYSGVYVRGEKITYHSAESDEGVRKLSKAYLEFDRHWRNLGPL